MIYGLSLSAYFGFWVLKDNAALEGAVKMNKPQAELRHRINVGFEGVWFLLSNMIVIAGISLVTDRKIKMTNYPNTIDPLYIFYFPFGMLRQAIWQVSPEMKQMMLKD